MKKIFSLFKFIIRLVFIFSISIILLIFGYVNFFCDDIKIIEKTVFEISNTKILKEYNINFSEISEEWSLYGLNIKIKDLNVKKDNIEINTPSITASIDLIESIKLKKIKIKSITLNDPKILIKENKEIKKISKKNLILDVKNIIDEMYGIEIKINNLNIKDENKKINLENIDLNKHKEQNKIFIHYNDRLKTYTEYKIVNENLIIHSNIKTNNYYLSKIIKHLGLKFTLDFIGLNDIYTVVGDLTSDVNLNFNLKNKVLDDYYAKIKMNGNKVVLNVHDSITLTNAIGNLYYTKDKGFYTDNIVANLNKRKTNLKITQDYNKGIDFDFETSANINTLSKIAHFELNKYFDGSDSFKGKYRLNFDKEDSLEVYSDFKNINYKTKTNLKKANGFKLKGFFDYEKEFMNFSIKQGTNSVKLRFIDNEFFNVDIGINKEIMEISKEKGFFISGYLENVILFNLFEDLKKTYSVSSSTEKNGEYDLKANITLNNLKIDDLSFKDVNLLYQNNVFSLLFDDDISLGSFYLNTTTKEIEINLEKLKINTSRAKKIIEKTKTDIEKSINDDFSIDYKKIKEEPNYSIILNADEVIINNKKPFSIKTKIDLNNGIFKSDEIIITDSNEIFTLIAQYEYDLIKNITKIKQKNEKTPLLKIHDFNKLKKVYLKDQNISLESKKITLLGYFSWSGFKINEIGKTLNANFSIDIKEGKIKENNASIGIAKTLNIFNFDAWFEMFTFDFDNIKSGLPFDSIKGNFKIKNNILNISPRIIVDSKLLFLEIKGDIDYVNSTYNLDIDAIVPLINKAPIIALFAGVAPEIVGVIWLVDKLAGEELNEMFSKTSFKVDGTFENPIYLENND